MRQFLVVVLAMSAVLAFGCGDESGDEKPRIGVIQITLEHEYQVILNKGFKDKAAEMGVEVLVEINDMSPEKCITAAENLIAAGAKAIIVAPADPGSFKAVAKLCKRSGVFVLNDGSPQPVGQGAVPFIGTDSYSGGLKAAEFAAKWIKENLSGKKVVVAHLTLPTFTDCVQRNKGFEDGLAKQLAGVKYEIHSENGKGSREGGLTATENLLQAHPDINVVFGCNDDSALGGYSAMKAAGKKDAENLVIGFDGSLGAFEEIKKGGMFRADIVQLPYKYAQMHMERAVKLVRGESKVEDYVAKGHDFREPPIVTKDNADEFIARNKKWLGK
jgi:ABC-type sugar transport system substrate-binding protein